MDLANLPAKIPTPWASAAGGGFIRVIPATSQIGVQDGAASWPTGFVPDNFIPVNAGGVPPFGEDFNGALNLISAWAQWSAFGGTVLWDSVFAAAQGGYPEGAFLLSLDGLHFWMNSVDGNATNPDTGGAGWVAIGPFGNIMSLNIGAGLFNDGHGNLAAAGGTETYVIADMTAAPGAYLVDTSGGAVVITAIDTPVRGQGYTFTDCKKKWGTSFFTFNGNGHDVGNPELGLTGATMTFKVSGLKASFFFNADGIWELF